MSLGENCAASCLTRDHHNWGACVRSQNQKVGYCRSATGGGDYSEQKQFDRDLDAYKAARANGIQPSTTRRSDVERAVKISELSGTAWDAGAGSL